ncbi:MAG: sigma-54 dependent transcriptional regulator [Gemmatimonadota bacterium]
MSLSDAQSPADVQGLLALDPEDKANLRVLLVDDDRNLRDGCESILVTDGYTVTTCGRGEDGLDMVRRKKWDIVLVDLYMSQVSGMDILDAAMETHPATIVIVMTGNPSVETSIEALRLGAWDYLPKPFSAAHLQILIGRAAHAVLVAKESETEEPPDDQHAVSSGNADLPIIGSSPVFQQMMDLARRVAPTDASVFIVGESGAGKELVAQYIHHHSRRRSRELVSLNCAALPEGLLESEMFGHIKGSFTGAVKDKPGLIEAANGGTLFLDELTEMSMPTQAKLLRVIQDGVVRRVGSNTTDAVVNVRFLAATNRDPIEAVDSGALRRDLYYRLRVVPLEVPPLRDRHEDIPVLARHFLGHYWKRHRDGRSAVPTLNDEAIRALQGRSWPGNVRELQNVMEHSVILLDAGTDVGPEDLPFAESSGADGRAQRKRYGPEIVSEPYHDARERVLAEFEQEYLVWLVNQAGGNMSKAARIAGVDRTTLYRLMEKHGLQRDTIIKTADNAETR